MAEEGYRPAEVERKVAGSDNTDTTSHTDKINIPQTTLFHAPTSPRASAAVNAYETRASLDLDDYFTGPRDISRHSKWPLFLRLHGSIVPKMIVPLLFIGAWSTAVVVISHHYADNGLGPDGLGVNSVLLTIMGFTISLGLSFRSSTAYERYAEGRRYWGTLVTTSHNLGRVIWIHANDPPEQDIRESMLRKLSAMNLLVAFSVALKHALRFEPYTGYADLQSLVGHLNTFAKEATSANPQGSVPPNKNLFKEVGGYLGISFAASNPRKQLKKSSQPLGNLPLEIISHLAVVIDRLVQNKQLDIPMQQTLAYNNLNMLNDILVGCERVLSTPLPLAYSIAITQITWVYVMLLPFQLIVPLKNWIAIPATIAASYIILGLLLIGEEIENPFGVDVNDLPLEGYCMQIAADLDVIAAYDKSNPDGFIQSERNLPLYPASTAPMATWMQRSEESLRHAIKSKPGKTFQWKRMREEGKSIVGDEAV
jgi:predicted membrane chloride channel (bestrophin family)